MEITNHGEATVLRHFHIANLVEIGELRLKELFKGDIIAKKAEPANRAQLFSAVVDIAERNGWIVPPACNLRMLIQIGDQAGGIKFAHVGKLIGEKRFLI